MRRIFQKRAGILAAVKGVVIRSAIAQRNIKKPIGTETHLTTLVISERFRHFQQNALGTEVSAVGVRGRHFKFADHVASRELSRPIAVLLAVENVKKTVRLEAGMKGHAHQSYSRVLPGLHIRSPVLDVQKFLYLTAITSARRHKNAPRLLNHEEAVRTIRGLGHPDRPIKRQRGEDRTELNFRKCLGSGQKMRQNQQARQNNGHRAAFDHFPR